MTFPPDLSLPPALAQLLGASSDAVFTLSREGRITYANPRAIANLTPRELVGLHLERDLRHVFSDRWLTESRRALEEDLPVEYDALNPVLG